MSWWKKESKDKELENEICIVCLYSAWDCICVNPDETQYIRVGNHTKQAISALRKDENVVHQKRKT